MYVYIYIYIYIRIQYININCKPNTGMTCIKLVNTITCIKLSYTHIKLTCINCIKGAAEAARHAAVDLGSAGASLARKALDLSMC